MAQARAHVDLWRRETRQRDLRFAGRRNRSADRSRNEIAQLSLSSMVATVVDIDGRVLRRLAVEPVGYLLNRWCIATPQKQLCVPTQVGSRGGDGDRKSPEPPAQSARVVCGSDADQSRFMRTELPGIMTSTLSGTCQPPGIPGKVKVPPLATLPMAGPENCWPK